MWFDDILPPRTFTLLQRTVPGRAIARIDDLDRQQGPVAMTLFRITQEALMNVHRHAHASRAEVRLSRSRGRLQLEVADDGIGIAGITNTGPSPAFAGVGIAGMRARMTNLGGELLLSNRNPGLQVLARLPTPPL